MLLNSGAASYETDVTVDATGGTGGIAPGSTTAGGLVKSPPAKGRVAVWARPDRQAVGDLLGDDLLLGRGLGRLPLHDER
jgi:hypothetical protein